MPGPSSFTLPAFLRHGGWSHIAEASNRTVAEGMMYSLTQIIAELLSGAGKTLRWPAHLSIHQSLGSTLPPDSPCSHT